MKKKNTKKVSKGSSILKQNIEYKLSPIEESELIDTYNNNDELITQLPERYSTTRVGINCTRRRCGEVDDGDVFEYFFNGGR